MSAQDTGTLVKTLTKVDEQDKVPTCCICRLNTSTQSTPIATEFDLFLCHAFWSLMETWVRSFVLIPDVVGKGWKASCSELSSSLREDGALNTHSSEVWPVGVGGLAATGRVVLFWPGVGGLPLG